MDYVVYDTIENGKALEFVRQLEEKASITVPYGDVKHIIVSENGEVSNLFVLDESIMIKNSEMKFTFKDFDNTFKKRSNVNLNSLLAINKKPFEEHLLELFSLNK